MIFLCFDLATTGLFKDGQDPPHIVGIAAAVFDDDKTLSAFDVMVKPDGFSIPDDAEAVHGINQKQAARYGVPLRGALAMLTNMADTVRTVVTYGLESYDARVVRASLQKFGSSKPFPLAGVEGVCVRELATPICKVPREDGTFKWPDLSTASLTILERPLRSRAVQDQMLTTAEIYRTLKRKGI